MRIYMQSALSEEKQPRFYQLLLEQDLFEGWNLVKESGAQGSSGRVVREHFATRDDAENALIKARDAQLARGYRVVFIKGDAPPR